MLLDQIVHSFVTFLVILDPPGVAILFVSLMREATEDARRKAAIQATAIAGAIKLIKPTTLVTDAATARRLTEAR